ncbi:MAG TPA: hypothetical protein QF901_10280 [Gammaproteobacteria bacterium]|nr:hypothetical protein [Gammaproteobacteria bacterium]
MSRYCNGERVTVRRALITATLALMIRCLPAAADELGVELSTPAPGADAAVVALRRAERAITKAVDAGNLWSGTRALLSAAAARADVGDYSRAVVLAGSAEREARAALNQARLERARYLLGALADDEDPETLSAIRGLLRAYDGDAALRLVRKSSGR